MTTKGSINEIRARIERAANKDENIRITYQIDRSVNFLDVEIINECGRLRTKVYHKPAAEPYILPFTSTHSHHIHQNIPYGALLRAARICSNVYDFYSECCHIDICLLLNGYPPTFIKKQFHRLADSNEYDSAMERMTETVYNRLHQKLLHQPTKHEQRLQQMMSNPIEAPAVLQPSIWNSKILYPPYLHDKETTIHLPNEFMKWWREFFVYPGSSVNDVKVRVVAKKQRTLEDFLIRKKPPRQLLTAMD